MRENEFFETLKQLVQSRQVAIQFKNYRMGGYTTHSFIANATSWEANGGPIVITYDQDVTDEEFRKAREADGE